MGSSRSSCQRGIDLILRASPKDKHCLAQKPQAPRRQMHLDLAAYSFPTSIYCLRTMRLVSTVVGTAATSGPDGNIGLARMELITYKYPVRGYE